MTSAIVRHCIVERCRLKPCGSIWNSCFSSLFPQTKRYAVGQITPENGRSAIVHSSRYECSMGCSEADMRVLAATPDMGRDKNGSPAR